jgi:ADP-ribose pyrophosphatase
VQQHAVVDRLAGEAVYDGVLLHVRRDTVRLPDGRPAVREYIEHPGAVTIVPVFDSGELLMERQFRYPVGEVLYELPAGKIDPGEPTLATAQRELAEETGYAAREWRYLTAFYPVVGYSNERIELWLARGLEPLGAPRLDDGEFLETFPVALAIALDWVRTGRIADAKTIIGLAWAEKLAAGAWAPPEGGPALSTPGPDAR